MLNQLRQAEHDLLDNQLIINCLPHLLRLATPQRSPPQNYFLFRINSLQTNPWSGKCYHEYQDEFPHQSTFDSPPPRSRQSLFRNPNTAKGKPRNWLCSFTTINSRGRARPPSRGRQEAQPDRPPYDSAMSYKKSQLTIHQQIAKQYLTMMH